MSENKSFLSVDAIAEMLEVTPECVRRWIRSGDLPAVRIGRVIRVKASDFNAFIDRNTDPVKKEG